MYEIVCDKKTLGEMILLQGSAKKRETVSDAVWPPGSGRVVPFWYDSKW